jgi:hypothetical protein
VAPGSSEEDPRTGEEGPGSGEAPAAERGAAATADGLGGERRKGGEVGMGSLRGDGASGPRRDPHACEAVRERRAEGGRDAAGKAVAEERGGCRRSSLSRRSEQGVELEQHYKKSDDP